MKQKATLALFIVTIIWGCTFLWLKQALDKYNFDAAFIGARRDEEKSRAKERIFSFRDSNNRWNIVL